MNDNKIMNMAADNIRILAASMVEKAKSGHPGGAMGGADFINTLYSSTVSTLFTTLKILHGRAAIVSSSILVTWPRCSTASSPLSVNIPSKI